MSFTKQKHHRHLPCTMLISILFTLLFPLKAVDAQEMEFFLPGSDTLETVEARFAPPEGYRRIPVEPGSFAAWLRSMPLLPGGAIVRDYRGRQRVPASDTSLAAVSACIISNRRLDQCMDIIMRMHAAWLLDRERPEDIVFPLPDGLSFSWDQWRQGYRPAFAGTSFSLSRTAEADAGPGSFERYLRTLFSYTGTQAFYHYYPDVAPDSAAIGDFIVKKGRNGHAVLIVDMVESGTGHKKALIGQGDTPACRFYLLKGKNGENWIDINDAETPLRLPIRKKMTWDGLRRFVCISKE